MMSVRCIALALVVGSVNAFSAVPVRAPHSVSSLAARAPACAMALSENEKKAAAIRATYEAAVKKEEQARIAADKKFAADKKKFEASGGLAGAQAREAKARATPVKKVTIAKKSTVAPSAAAAKAARERKAAAAKATAASAKAERDRKAAAAKMERERKARAAAITATKAKADRERIAAAKKSRVVKPTVSKAKAVPKPLGAKTARTAARGAKVTTVASARKAAATKRATTRKVVSRKVVSKSNNAPQTPARAFEQLFAPIYMPDRVKKQRPDLVDKYVKK